MAEPGGSWRAAVRTRDPRRDLMSVHPFSACRACEWGRPLNPVSRAHDTGSMRFDRQVSGSFGGSRRKSPALLGLGAWASRRESARLFLARGVNGTCPGGASWTSGAWARGGRPAGALRLAPNTVSTLVGRLTAAGLLERARSAADGRSVRLSVTGQARRRMAGWRDLRAELAARALDRLTAGDRQALADAGPALLRFAAQLEEESA
jgi:DNA-binding MarR family transcriptional regulator